MKKVKIKFKVKDAVLGEEFEHEATIPESELDWFKENKGAKVVGGKSPKKED